MGYVDPTSGEFTSFFNRDFPYSMEGDQTGVMPSDITKALTQQQNTINPDLFPNQNVYSQGALLLAAFNLVQNLRTSSQGIAAKFDWTTNSKSVGPVSGSFTVPERISENPMLAIYASNTYGVQYLQLILPYLVGQMFAVRGDFVEGTGQFGGPFGGIGPWSNG